MHVKAIPPQFELIRRGRKKLILRKELSGDLVRLGVENPWKWADNPAAGVRYYSGRVPAASLNLPLGGGLPVVLRRYRHGGALGRLQRDLYFFSFTPLRELLASSYAQQQGIPVAEILGAVQERVGIFHRSDLLMKHLPEGTDLGVYFSEVYSRPFDWKEKKEIIRAVAQLVRRTHDAGLLHADLHLKNIYMAGPAGARQFYLLDLDKARIVPSLPSVERRKNLLRFHRYLEKYFGGRGTFSRADRLRFLESYLGTREEARAFARRHGKTFERHVRRHRMLWPKKIFDPAWWTYAFFRGLMGLLNRLPEKMAYTLGGAITRSLYFIDGRHRRRAKANLERAFGDSLSKKERARLARRHFEQVGFVAMETVRSLRMDEEDLDRFYARQEVVGIENLREGLRRGKGILLLVSHLGNWELMSLVARHVGMPLSVLAKPIKNRWIDAWINRVRRRLGMRVIKASRLNRAILENLSQNHAVAMLIDQNPGHSAGEMVPFFGKPAPTTVAPAYFALKSGATVIPAYSIRVKPGKFKIVIEPPLELVRESDLRRALVANTELFSQKLERYVRRYPEQWWWLHDRWKTKKIWVKLPNWVGDVLMAFPFLRGLRRRYPEGRIAVSVKESLASLLREHPDVDEVIPERRRKGIRGVADRLRDIREIQRGDYSMAYVLPRSWDSALVPYLAGIEKILGYGNAGRGIMLKKKFSRNRITRQMHQSEYYLNLVIHHKRWQESDKELFWRLPPSVEQWADDYFRKHFPGKKVVGIAPGATYGSAKMWLPERYRALARRLTAQHPEVAVVFFGSAAEGVWIDPLMRDLPSTHLLTGKTDLPQLAALMKRCTAVLTNDSGPMHVAAAVKAPLIVLFGPTDYERTGPRGPHTLIHKRVACSPCKLRECPIDHRCMTGISVDEVYNAVVEKL